MTAIVNNFTHPVIEADDRDPDVSWQHQRTTPTGGLLS